MYAVSAKGPRAAGVEADRQGRDRRSRHCRLTVASVVLSVLVPGLGIGGSGLAIAASGGAAAPLPVTDGNGRLLTPAKPDAPSLYERGANAAATVRDYTGWAIFGAASAAGSAVSTFGGAVGGYIWGSEDTTRPGSRYSEPASASFPKPVPVTGLRGTPGFGMTGSPVQSVRTETVVPPAIASVPTAVVQPESTVTVPPVEAATASPQGMVPEAGPVAMSARRPPEPMAPRTAAPEPELTLRTAMVEGVGIVGEPAQRLGDGALFVPKPAQRMMVVRTLRTEVGDVPDTRELMGRVIPDPSHSGRVMAVQSGRVHVAPTGMPYLGQAVEKGQVLGYIEPVLPVSERTALLSELATVSTDLKTAKERLVRTETFFFVPFREGKVRLAEIEIEGLRKRYAVLSSMITRREELRAPSAGVISAVNVVAGQVVDLNVALFEIINPNRLWVEAVAFDASIGDNIAKATATTLDQRGLTLRFIGSGRSLRQQSVPMQFELIDPPSDLQEGQPVRLYVAGPAKSSGVMVPRRAVVRADNGEPIVFERTAPEKFEPRRVIVDPVDAERVVVRSGLQAGVPIVVNGAQLLSQVR